MKIVIIFLLASFNLVSCTQDEEKSKNILIQDSSKLGKQYFYKATSLFIKYQQSKSKIVLDSALLYIDSAISFRKNWALAYGYKQSILLYQKKYSEALKTLEIERNIDFKESTYYYTKGLLLEKMGIIDSSTFYLSYAKNMAIQEITKNPNDLQNSMSLMAVLLAQRDSIGYENEYKRISQIYPTKAELKLFYNTYENYLPKIRRQNFLDFILNPRTIESKKIK